MIAAARFQQNNNVQASWNEEEENYPAGVLFLEAVGEPIKEYLRGRKDTIKCIVTMLTNGAGGNPFGPGSTEDSLLDELNRDEENQESFCLDDDVNTNDIQLHGLMHKDPGEISRQRHDIAVCLLDPLDASLGHSFCYIRPDPPHKIIQDDSGCNPATQTAAFHTISGASISANISTPLSTEPFPYANSTSLDKASAFESYQFFSSIFLQPIPRNSFTSVRSSPILKNSVPGSGLIERRFLSGPIGRSFVSSPLENQFDQLQRYKPKISSTTTKILCRFWFTSSRCTIGGNAVCV
ncbi:putative protein phosphatase 2C 4 [Forsythia ovata]|uniref:Uncharacterized protein n=1 Tax=Forsythia ovata TaxID=205694 RepID=A0ABD1WJF1_9LAMI